MYVDKERKTKNGMFTEDSMEVLSQGVVNTLQDEELMDIRSQTMRSIMNSEYVNKDPLTNVPNPEMRLYGISGTYFNTKEELENYCISEGFPMNHAYALEYIRNFAGRSDVIRKTNPNGECKYYVAVDENGYGVYNHDMSVYKGKFTWEFECGSIEEMYSAFRDRGVEFEKDVYGKIFEKKEQFLEMCRKNSLFGPRRKKQ